MSVWADVASRYREGRELRTASLKSRFIAQFEGGSLTIQLPSGATRRIDSAEFASAWTLLETGASPASIRMVTTSAQYLEAIRADLHGSGLAKGVVGSDDDVDVGTTAAALITEATVRSVVNAEPAVESSPDAAAAQLETVLTQRDDLVRELARAKAAIAVAEDRLRTEEERANQLEIALAAKPRAAAPATTGAKMDPIMSFAAFVSYELQMATGIDARIRAGLREALEVSVRHPDLAVVQCRKVAEAIAEAQYLRVTGSDEVPRYSKAIDLMEDVRDREGVDMVVWNLHRNIFRVSNPAAHVLRQAGSRQFAMTLVAVVLVVASHVRTDG
jgi:hypothetical protein